MDILKLVGSTLVAGGDDRIIFGCPTEVHKAIIKEQRHYPNTIVCSDIIFQHGVTLYAPEFLAMGHLFLEGGFNFGTMSIDKLQVVGTKEQVDRMREVLRITFLGPSEAEYLDWGVGEPERKQLWQESCFFYLKDKNKHNYQSIDDYIEPRYYDTDGVCTLRSGVRIKHHGDNKFTIIKTSGSSVDVAIEINAPMTPVWKYPDVNEAERPHRFGLRVIGAASGFFYEAPSTTYLLSINNQFYLWDCAPYCSQALLRRGLTTNQISGIIISHVHDDHCSDLIPFALSSGRKVEVITTLVIWKMVLVKLSQMMDKTPAEVADFFTWIEVDVAKSTFINGAVFEWVYGVHAIPSIGAKITFDTKTIYISGDTGSKSVLDKMLQAGAISSTRHEQLVFLLSGHYTSFVDCGEAIIHGMPEDFKDVEDPHEIIFSHRSSLPEGYSNFNLAEPGKMFIYKQSNSDLTDGVLISSVMMSIGVRDTKWSEIFTLEKCCMEFSHHEVIIAEGSKERNYFYIIARGVVEARVSGNTTTRLERGDFFGAQAIIDDGQHQSSSFVSVTPVRLIAIRADLFRELIAAETVRSAVFLRRFPKKARRMRREDMNVLEILERLWERRYVISSAKIFQGIGNQVADELALRSESVTFAVDDLVIRKGSNSGDIFIIAHGAVEVLNNFQHKNPVIGVNGLVGTMIADAKCDLQPFDIKAIEPTICYKIKSDDFVSVLKKIPRANFNLHEELADSAEDRANLGAIAQMPD